MRNVQRLIAAAVLSCVLAISALAGHIATGVAGPQPAPSPTTTTETGTQTANTSGHIATGIAGSDSDSLAEAALSIINGLLALL